ncbi:MAG: choloylglycine hydrolase family protein [Clostridia bacterium]|nr:choloylglycine hydrolase family protein [Clostridia bacterium]
MCTAVYYDRGNLFGRTLDLECSLGECIAAVPRAYPFRFRRLPELSLHYAFIGTAHAVDGNPLFYDGMNEHGVAVAALNFPGYAKYGAAQSGKINLCSFELIPYVLASARTLDDARELLRDANLTDDAYSDTLPATPLHFLISTKDGSLTVEQGEGGFRLLENPLGVLSNAPELSYHITRLSDYYALDSARGEQRLATDVPLSVYSRGMGAIGLPGDFSSSSRFVRAVYAKNNTSPTVSGDEMAALSAFFHIMDTVGVPNGCVVTDAGESVRTVYTSAMDLSRLVYYFRGYDSGRIFSVKLQCGRAGDKLELFDIPDDVKPLMLN